MCITLQTTNTRIMKKLIIALFILPTFLFAGQLEKVVSYTKDYKSNAWYVEQALLWQQALKKDKQNQEAWLNYFMACRYAKLTSDDWKSQKQSNKLQDSETISKDAYKAIPETYVGYYLKWKGTNGSHEQIDLLEKAYELEPNRPEVYEDLLAYYEVNRNKEKTKEFAAKLAQQPQSLGIYALNYNIINPLDYNAVLFTNGNNDTYPLWVMQNTQQLRTDVQVINIHLLFKDKFRESIIKELKLPAMGKTMQDFESNAAYIQALLGHIVKQCKRPVYFASTVAPSNYEAFQEQLYLEGVALKYSPERYDNIAVLKRNVEKKFLLDHLKVNLIKDVSESVVNRINSSYLWPFTTLYQHYEESEELEKASALKILISSIAKKGGQEEEISAFFDEPELENNSDNDREAPTEFNIKHWEATKKLKSSKGAVRYIDGNIYTYYTEVPNWLYNQMLNDFVKDRDFEKLEMCKVHPVDWESLIPAVYRNPEALKRIYEHGHPNDNWSAVSNVTHEAANVFAQWVTNTYNADPKRQFNKVLFRLPTEKEWEMAASIDGQDIVYAWGGPYVYNKKGCYLGNLRVAETKIQDPAECDVLDDGGVFVVGVHTYWPTWENKTWGWNGNVAEMVQEKGVCKGGGWNTLPENATIQSKEQYEGHSPNVGFRIFMEVIEE